MPKKILKNCFFGLDMELEPKLFKSRSRNHYFSKVGTGTVNNSCGSTTLAVSALSAL
jgi:hypothetical protein